LREAAEISGMSTSGLCQVCERAEGQYTCDHCGQFVCTEHYSEETHTCVACARDAGMGDDEEPSGFGTET